MSNILKSIGNAIKKIVKSPIFKAVLIAVAIYFTAGLAAGAMGSVFAAGLPGIATAAEALGVTSGAFAAGAAGLAEAGVGAVAAGAAGDAFAAAAGGEAATTFASAAGEAVGVGGAAADAVGSAAADVGGAAGAVTDVAPAGGGIVNSAPSALADSLSAGTTATPDLAGIATDATGAATSANPAAASLDVASTAAPAVSPEADIAASTSNVAAPAATDIGTNTVTSGTSSALPNAGSGIDSATDLLAKKAAGPNMFDKFGSWWGGLSPASQNILGQAGLGAGKAVIGAIGNNNNNAVAEQKREFDIKQANTHVNPGKPSPYNGIINSMFSRPNPVTGA